MVTLFTSGMIIGIWMDGPLLENYGYRIINDSTRNSFEKLSKFYLQWPLNWPAARSYEFENNHYNDKRLGGEIIPLYYLQGAIQISCKKSIICDG
jgi:hypothetical protein